MIQIYATFNQYIFTLKTTQTESEVIKIDILWNWQSETIPGDNTELCFQQSGRHIPFKIFIEYYPRYVHARQQINLNKFKKTEDMLNVFTLEWKGFAFRLNFSCGRKDICKVFDISNLRSALIETKLSDPMELDELILFLGTLGE